MDTTTKKEKLTDKTFEVKKKVTYSDVASLLCSAFEGGSNYWAMISKVNKPKLEDKHIFVNKDGTADDIFNSGWTYATPFSKGGSIIFVDVEEQDAFEPATLNLESIQRGLDVMADKYERHFSDFLNENGDADTGDVFLQCCLFGDVIFG